ncbi:MAG: methionine synthase [Gammaproteobacteria bacterium]|nr:MAG: methionine synthase [Gammaproteobacteria bacterium]
MALNSLAKLLSDRPWLLCDGATGTNYFSLGLQSGEAPELWNVTHPTRVSGLHEAFVDAGADIILTNSFGGSSYRLKLHQADHRVIELNRAAAAIAKGVAERAGRPIVVAGSIGPTGEILKPVGLVDASDAELAFQEQATALAAGGADVLWLETMSSTEEMRAAALAAATTGLPVVATMTFDTNGSTMMGVSPQQLVDLYRELVPGLVAFGANVVSVRPPFVGALMAMRQQERMARFWWRKETVAFRSLLMVRFITAAHRTNVGVCPSIKGHRRANIGGCCGTTPEHLAAMNEALVDHVPKDFSRD